MDPNPKSFPLLSYVMAQLLPFGPDQRGVDRTLPGSSIQSPESSSSSSSSGATGDEIVHQMPQLNNPKLLEAMTRAIFHVAETRSVIHVFGERPDYALVEEAKIKLEDMKSVASKEPEKSVLSPRCGDVDRLQWREMEKEKNSYKAMIQLHEMHDAYDKLLKEAEKTLVKIYESAGVDKMEEASENWSEAKEEAVGILQDVSGKGLEWADLSHKHLQHLPQSLGRIPSLLVLNVSSNQFKAIPDSVGWLEKLEELNVSSNFIESLPDSIGLLKNLKILNVSGNKLVHLPDTISLCSSLVELDGSYNKLQCLPADMGRALQNLERLLIQMNKIRYFPPSICEMRCLRYLDARFNELRGLPVAFGKLSNLEYLNLSRNFSDLKALPETFGVLVNLKELDVSHNQIHALPDTFGHLENLVNLNLEHNPLVTPPMETVNQGAEAVKSYMVKRWRDILIEKETQSKLRSQFENGWLNLGAYWFRNVSEYLGHSDQNDDPVLEQRR